MHAQPPSPAPISQRRLRRVGAALLQWTAACCLLLAGLPARALDYSVGVQQLDYFPIYSGDAQGNYSGYARELLDLFARHNGFRFVYRVRPVTRAVKEYLAGQTDFMFPDNPSWDRTAKKGLELAYSRPAVSFEDAVMVLPERLGSPIASLGIVRGFTPWKFLPAVRAEQLQLQEAPGPANLIGMALLKRVDGINIARQVADFHLHALGRPGALLADPALMPKAQSHYLLSSIRHPEMIERFDHFLQSEQAAVTALRTKYGL